MVKRFIAGGAGFIGSHIVDWVLRNLPGDAVTVFDNFSSRQRWHLAAYKNDPRLNVVRGDIKDLPALTRAMAGHEMVYHFASNPDIAKAMRQPDVDFWEGTYLTQNVLDAIRVCGVKRLIYASGSGVYGEGGTFEFPEDHGPLLPISTYGASKLAGEALINAYCCMFGLTARAYRFANVVGPRQTHGVAFDFVNRLRDDPRHLRILGDGTQSKSYILVHDILDAIDWTDSRSQRQFDYFNVATGDYITVKEIADLVVKEMGLVGQVQYEFTGGDRGWKGDVPMIRFNLDKITAMGWKAKFTSRQALQQAIRAMLGGSAGAQV